MLRHTSFCLILAAYGSLLTAAEYPYANPADELAKIPWLKKTERQTNQPWHTQYAANANEGAYSGRIVSYCGKWTRHSYGGHGGLGNTCGWRYAKGPLTPRKNWTDIGQLITNEVDVDGDGDVTDDFVFSLVHSMDVPHSIPDWPAANVFPERQSATFYGGTTFYCANNTPKKLGNFSYEMGINADHSPPFRDSRAEDHPINGARHKKIAGSFLRHYVTMLWKKEDFLNNGDDYRVSFNEQSRLAFLCTRGYWYGWDDIRYIVQNGDTMYISEILPDIPDYAFRNAKHLKKKSGYLPIRNPLKLKWAVYQPEGYKIDHNPEGVTYSAVVFDDVQVVGWYLSKTSDSPAQTHCKWYGFECDAVIHRPQAGSPNIDMKQIKPTAAELPPFMISTCEVPYSLWQDIYRYGDSSHHVLESRYIYEKSGSMGSMAYGKREHSHDEPLTDLTFYDMLATCNTLSEMEGKTPCYYVDEAHTEVFRNRHLATYAYYTEDDGTTPVNTATVRNFKNPTYFPQAIPKVYVRWTADGHRLPTPAEWLAACGPIEQTEPSAADGTHTVARDAANAYGLYDMIGNVWENCWTFGDVYDPETSGPVTALGGAFTTEAMSPYGDKPYKGTGAIGLRLVCRDAGLTTPTQICDLPAEIPQLQFTQTDTIGAVQQAETVAEGPVTTVALPAGSFVRHDKKTVQIAAMFMAETGTTYDQWKTVRQWAEAHGYTFCKNGDMGSMYFFNFIHSPDEPVTHIQWWDMLTWCNALSEMEGRTPMYYYDESCTTVVRQSFAYRPIKMHGWEYIQMEPPFSQYLNSSFANPRIFVTWDGDGYRLPTASEFDYAARGGSTSDYPWGDDKEQAGDYMWNAANAQGRTHPVGLKKANGFGLYDIQGNVFEWSWSNDGKKNKVRSYARDLDNPLHSAFWCYNQSKKMYGPHKNNILVSGPSYLYGGFDLNGTHGVGINSSPASDNTHYYQDVGFRVVRCDAGTHPRDGLRPLADEIIIQYLKADPSTYVEFGQ